MDIDGVDGELDYKLSNIRFYTKNEAHGAMVSVWIPLHGPSKCEVSKRVGIFVLCTIV